MPPAVAAVVQQLAALPIPWAIAGGWALDLVLGRQTREHADVDVALFRADQVALRAARPGWHFEVVAEGRRVPWPAGAWLALPVHELYALPTAPPPAEIEFLLNERDGDAWVYRRAPAVRRSLHVAFTRSALGVSLLAPELVLLYKSRALRAQDEADFAAMAPHLGPEPRAWLRAALSLTAPDHPWLPVLHAPDA